MMITTSNIIRLLCILFVLASDTAIANSIEDNRVGAECMMRAFFLQFSSEAYARQQTEPKFRQKQEAVEFVINKTRNQNLKPKESRALISSFVGYVYGSLRPQANSLVSQIELKDNYNAYCLSNPKEAIGNLYVVDFNKASSIYTEGEYHVRNKDGIETICSRGKCEKQEEQPPTSGVTYAEARKALLRLNWTPNPTALAKILAQSGQLTLAGTKLDTGEVYGNCLSENSLCDKSKPELADCLANGSCSAVWSKGDRTVWYTVKDNQLRGYGSAGTPH